VVQPDGKIVAGGSVGTEGRTGHSNVVLVRYKPDGTLDTSFGTGGMVVGGPGAVEALGLDAAGDIFTLGRFTLPGEDEFSPAGVQDVHVAAAPITTSSPSSLDDVNGLLAFLPTGQTLAGGSVFVSGSARSQDDDAQVQRLNADGTVDATFASPPIDYNGQEGQFIHFGMDSLAVQPDGKILLGGGVGLARVNPDGTLDTTFGTAAAELAVPATLPVLLANAALLAVLPNGEFLAIGAGTNPTTGVDRADPHPLLPIARHPMEAGQATTGGSHAADGLRLACPVTPHEDLLLRRDRSERRSPHQRAGRSSPASSRGYQAPARC
jgi:uncharacterized delta-60 repeat protein